MAKIVRFKETELINFAGLRSKTVQYGNITALSGRNGQGKTSIGTAPVWVLFGKDLLGSDYTKDKYSPRPSNYEYDRVYASILLSVDGTEYKFARETAGKTNSFYVNDIPQAATAYNAAVATLFTQDEFMALYFPAYFFGLHWTKQRELLMKGVAAPLNKTVFAEMSRTSPEQKAKDIILNPQAVKLSELVKKHTLDDLVAKHKKDKTQLEKTHIAAQSRTKTLREQMDRLPAVEIDLEAKRAEHAAIEEQIQAIEAISDKAGESNHVYNQLAARIDSLQEQVCVSAAGWKLLKAEQIKDTCPTCKQSLQAEAIDAVTANKELRMEAYKAKHSAIVVNRKEAEAELATLQYIDVSEQLQKVRELDQRLEPIKEAIRNHNDRARLATDVEKAAADEAATLAGLRESTFVLDAIKAYKSKEAELQAAEIQSKFTTLSIRLFKYVKSSDEYEPDFSVQAEGKDYSFLSAGEKIGAGLELIEVLFKQSDLITPVFVDGIGEYTGPIAAYDQVITGRAIPEQDLKIEVDGVEM